MPRTTPPKLLAFDPGGTTGWCLLLGDGTYLVGAITHWVGIEELLDRLAPELVVLEKFQLYPWLARQLAWTSFPTVEVIGIIKFLCSKRKIPVREQPAKAIKRVLLKPGTCPNVHSGDAMRHGLAYYRAYGYDGDYVRLYAHPPTGKPLRTLIWNHKPKRPNGKE